MQLFILSDTDGDLRSRPATSGVGGVCEDRVEMTTETAPQSAAGTPVGVPSARRADPADEHSALHLAVIGWFDAHARDLPWRRPEAGAWAVMVSEFMLQQTPVARVLPVYQEWLARWPSPADLAAEPPGEAVRAWGRLGYPRRALRLHAAATAISERHAGRVPAGHDELLALPGVGEYTAAAVASFAFRQRHAVLDTNVRRVFARAVTGVQYPPNATTAAERRLARGCCRTTTPPRPAGRRPPWSWAPWSAPPVPRAAAGARSPSAAPGGWPAPRRTTDRRGAARVTPAPTARCAASCSRCCGTPPARWPRPSWTRSGTTRCSAPGRWTAWSPTGWWSRWPRASTGCRSPDRRPAAWGEASQVKTAWTSGEDRAPTVCPEAAGSGCYTTDGFL
ncbi:protein of unknown function [Streptantibioticus cattleyicolor NRRL 8057 = DSM 46488]|nr:protein of unknown function [Streptantibioticus cattleyicolor NRRL 8057 = DSM 46488]